MTDTPLYVIFVREGKSKTRYKVGYLNPVGRTVIDPIYNNGAGFNEGPAAVCVQGGRWGIIDTRGNFIVEPKLSSWCHFSEGFANLPDRRGEWGVIGWEGRYVI